MLTFSLKSKTLRKLTLDDSVKYILPGEQTKEREIKQNTIKNKAPPRKQDKNVSQNNKKLIKEVAARGFSIFN